jgi:hypothetical protein
MAYLSPFTYEIIKDALEASAPSFTLKNNFLSNLISSVSYTLQGNTFIIPSVAGAILPQPNPQKNKYSILIDRERMLVNGIMRVLNYDLINHKQAVNAVRQVIHDIYLRISIAGNRELIFKL